MEKNLSCSVSIHEEMMDGKMIFVTECPELHVSDFGDTVQESLMNLKNGISLLLEEAPEKRALIQRYSPIMVTELAL